MEKTILLAKRENFSFNDDIAIFTPLSDHLNTHEYLLPDLSSCKTEDKKPVKQNIYRGYINGEKTTLKNNELEDLFLITFFNDRRKHLLKIKPGENSFHIPADERTPAKTIKIEVKEKFQFPKITINGKESNKVSFDHSISRKNKNLVLKSFIFQYPDGNIKIVELRTSFNCSGPLQYHTYWKNTHMHTQLIFNPEKSLWTKIKSSRRFSSSYYPLLGNKNYSELFYEVILNSLDEKQKNDLNYLIDEDNEITMDEKLYLVTNPRVVQYFKVNKNDFQSFLSASKIGMPIQIKKTDDFFTIKLKLSLLQEHYNPTFYKKNLSNRAEKIIKLLKKYNYDDSLSTIELFRTILYKVKSGDLRILEKIVKNRKFKAFNFLEKFFELPSGFYNQTIQIQPAYYTNGEIKPRKHTPWQKWKCVEKYIKHANRLYIPHHHGITIHAYDTMYRDTMMMMLNQENSATRILTIKSLEDVVQLHATLTKRNRAIQDQNLRNKINEFSQIHIKELFQNYEQYLQKNPEFTTDIEIALLDSSEKLVEEGKLMRHCVGSYHHNIVSLTRNCFFLHIKDTTTKEELTSQVTIQKEDGTSFKDFEDFQRSNKVFITVQTRGYDNLNPSKTLVKKLEVVLKAYGIYFGPNDTLGEIKAKYDAEESKESVVPEVPNTVIYGETLELLDMNLPF